MANDAQAVATRAIRDLGADYTSMNFADDAAFQTYVLEVATEVVAEHSERVGDDYSLDTIVLFRAAVLETESRMTRRILNSFYSGVLQQESIKLGPISLSSMNNATMSTYIQTYAEELHDEAEALLNAGGASGRKGAIRVWIPRRRIVII